MLGAYERGERSLSVLRLVRLASIYELPTQQLIPDAPVADDEEAPLTTIDLERIAGEGESVVVDRFLSSILMMRREPPGLAVRKSDMALLNSMLESLPERDPVPDA